MHGPAGKAVESGNRRTMGATAAEDGVLAHKATGNAALARGEHALAVREYSRALALAPADVALLCNRSAALLAAGDAHDALRDAEAARGRRDHAAQASVPAGACSCRA